MEREGLSVLVPGPTPCCLGPGIAAYSGNADPSHIAASPVLTVISNNPGQIRILRMPSQCQTASSPGVEGQTSGIYASMLQLDVPPHTPGEHLGAYRALHACVVACSRLTVGSSIYP